MQALKRANWAKSWFCTSQGRAHEIEDRAGQAGQLETPPRAQSRSKNFELGLGVCALSVPARGPEKVGFESLCLRVGAPKKGPSKRLCFYSVLEHDLPEHCKNTVFLNMMLPNPMKTQHV